MAPPIRRLSPDDAEAYASLRREMIVAEPFAFLGAPGDDRACDAAFVRSQMESPDLAYFGAFDGARLVAVAVLIREARSKLRHRVIIVSVYVTPAWRGHGLGRGVVAACVAHARAMPGVAAVELRVSVRATAARRLYESLGFVAWGTQPDAVRVGGETTAEVHMQLRV